LIASICLFRVLPLPLPLSRPGLFHVCAQNRTSRDEINLPRYMEFMNIQMLSSIISSGARSKKLAFLLFIGCLDPNMLSHVGMSPEYFF
jgi:hypothetical protein